MSLSRKYTHSVILNLILRFTSLFSTILYLFIIARIASRPTFALIGFLTLLRGILPRITKFGISYFIINQASKYIVNESPTKIRKSYSSSLKASFLLRLPILTLLNLILFYFKGNFLNKFPLFLMMLTFFASYIFFQFFRSWLRAFLKVKVSLLIGSLSAIFSSFTSLSLYLVFPYLSAIVLGWTLPYLISGIIAYLVVLDSLPRRQLKEKPNFKITWKNIINEGKFMYLFALISLLSGKLDQLFSAYLLNPILFASYFAMFRLAAGIFKVGLALRGQILSVFSHLKHRDPSRVRYAYGLVFKVVLIFSIGAISLATLFPELIINFVFGKNYLTSTAINTLLILLFGTFFRLLVPIFKSARKVMSKLKTLTIVEALSISFKGGLIWFLYPYGSEGIATSFLAMLLFQTIVLGFLTTKWIKIDPIAIAKGFLAASPLFLIRWGSLYLFSLSQLGKIACLIFSLFLYVILVSFLNPFENQEIRKIKQSSPPIIKEIIAFFLERE